MHLDSDKISHRLSHRYIEIEIAYICLVQGQNNEAMNNQPQTYFVKFCFTQGLKYNNIFISTLYDVVYSY